MINRKPDRHGNDFVLSGASIIRRIGRIVHQPRMDLYFRYLDYGYRIQRMIHSTNWIERLNRDCKRTMHMRGAMPNNESVRLLLGLVAMMRKAYQRKIPLLNHERNKFNWSE